MWEIIFIETTLTAPSGTYNLIEGKKFSDYDFILATAFINDSLMRTAACSFFRVQDRSFMNRIQCCTTDAVLRYDLKSDTTFTVYNSGYMRPYLLIGIN